MNPHKMLIRELMIYLNSFVANLTLRKIVNNNKDRTSQLM